MSPASIPLGMGGNGKASDGDSLAKVSADEGAGVGAGYSTGCSKFIFP